MEHEEEVVVNPFSKIMRGKKKKKNKLNFSRDVAEKLTEYITEYKYMI
jgi:histone H3/H4